MKRVLIRPFLIILLAFLFVSTASCDWSSYEEEEVDSEIEEYENDREEE
ncbi:hypothetical protein PQO03_10150 [Lentisphaera profundi]|uniref:Secreted protein n=1 Tax=Lentisphaera profundi TaxID=1658616 RepID=A0ABY7VRZ5_9BACT|nr:hypothetical protein [Lentisphaera profundi]WDE96074.1 hypothetical protein PQO03_10150 [Lentisphaera profundi]